MIAAPSFTSRTLRGAPVASRYERGLRPTLAGFSRPESTSCAGGDRL
jgi:hypothetical protein